MNQMPQGHVVLDGWNPEVERREQEAVEAGRLRAKRQERERRWKRRVEAAWNLVAGVAWLSIGVFKGVVFIVIGLLITAVTVGVVGTAMGVLIAGWSHGIVMGILSIPLALLAAHAAAFVIGVPCGIVAKGLGWLVGLEQ